MSDINIQLQAAKDIAASGLSFIKNMSPEDIQRMVKFLVDEIDRYDFDLDCARADAKNARWLFNQTQDKIDVFAAEAERLRDRVAFAAGFGPDVLRYPAADDVTHDAWAHLRKECRQSDDPKAKWRGRAEALKNGNDYYTCIHCGDTRNTGTACGCCIGD